MFLIKICIPNYFSNKIIFYLLFIKLVDDVSPDTSGSFKQGNNNNILQFYTSSLKTIYRTI